jgi:hypothetical protein
MAKKRQRKRNDKGLGKEIKKSKKKISSVYCHRFTCLMVEVREQNWFIILLGEMLKRRYVVTV